MVAMAGLVLAVAALAELAARLWLQPGEAARLGVATHGVVDVPAVLLLVVLCMIAAVPLDLRRPAVAAVTSCAACEVLLALFGLTLVTVVFAVLASGYLAGRSGAAGLAASLGAPFVVLAMTTSDASAALLGFGMPAAATAGLARRANAEARTLGAERAAAAGSQAQHLARGERARIARELHDVVAHHISMIAVQAETARLTTADLPAAGAKRFTEIGNTARAGLTEMRRLLGVLREDAAGDAAVVRHPQPGLGELNGLIDTARQAAGGLVRLIVSGQVASLDPGVELAAYRIVQEALTNARRHAPGAAVDVELRYGRDALRLRIRDNGPGGLAEQGGPGEGGAGEGGAGEGFAGHGIVGMRERAQAAGGSLTAGRAPGGGFLVTATLPALLEHAR